jgi:hypothetical protein
LTFSQLNVELRERHFLSCPVDIEIHDLGGGPTTRNRTNSCSNEFLDDGAAPKYSAGKVKSTLAVSNPYCSMINSAVFTAVTGAIGQDKG